jgi:hypothetical protein
MTSNGELRERFFTGPLPFFVGMAGGRCAERRRSVWRRRLSSHQLCTSRKAVHKWGDRIDIVPKTRRLHISLISHTLRCVRKLMSCEWLGTKYGVGFPNRLVFNVFPGTPKPSFSDTNRSVETHITLFIIRVQGVHEATSKTGATAS